MNEKMPIVTEEFHEDEVVMPFNETCSDCQHFNAGDSTCQRSGVKVDPDRRKCPYYYGF